MAMAKILRLLTLAVTCLMALSGAASAQEKATGATAAQPRSAAELGNLAEKLELTLKAAEDRGDKKAVIKELLNLGQVQAEMGNQSRALASIEMAKRLASDLGDKELKLASLAALAKAEADSGDLAQAIQTQKEAVDLSKEATDAKGQVAAINALAKLYLKSGEPDKALPQLTRALQVANTTNDEAGQREALTSIATVYAQRKDHARALSNHETALEMYRKVGDGEGIWRSMAGIADAKAVLGKPDEALASYTEATKVIEAQAAQRTGTGRPDPQAADKAAVYDKAIQLLRQGQKEGEATAYAERAKNLGYAQVPSAAAAVAAVAKTTPAEALATAVAAAQPKPAEPVAATALPSALSVAPGMAAISIRSEPTPANVFVDGLPSGQTPARVSVPQGQHIVWVAREGYRQWTQTVKATGGATHDLMAKLEPEAKTEAAPAAAEPEKKEPAVVKAPEAPAAPSEAPAAEAKPATAAKEVAVFEKTVTAPAAVEPAKRAEEKKEPAPVKAPEAPAPPQPQAQAVEAKPAPAAQEVVVFQKTEAAPAALPKSLLTETKPIETPNVGTVWVDSNPTDAEVRVGDKAQGRTPATLTLEAGTHRIQVLKDGYAPWERLVTVAGGRTYSIGVTLAVVLTPVPPPVRVVPPSAPPTTPPAAVAPQPVAPQLDASLRVESLRPEPEKLATLLVKSDPTGAMVRVDGQYQGITPLTASLKDGIHSVVLQREGYEDWKQEVTLKPALTQSLVVALRPLPEKPKQAMVRIESVPSDAAVRVNGQAAGKTPSELRLDEGQYRLEVAKDGFQTWFSSVDLKGGESRGYMVPLIEVMKPLPIKTVEVKVASPAPSAFVVAPMPSPTVTPAAPSPSRVLAPAAPTPAAMAVTPAPKPAPLPLDVPTPSPGDVVLIPAGEFLRGEDVGEPNQAPQQKIHVDAFYMDRREVTVSEYKRFVDYIRATRDHSKCHPKEPKDRSHEPLYWDEGRHRPEHPVTGVDWFDAYAYAAWAGKRLPTETEWEKAARGVDGRKYPWGNDEPGARANYDSRSNQDGFEGLSPVGQFGSGASPFGCLDMAGNAWEWCADWYARDAYVKTPNTNPQGPPTGTTRVVRGGSYLNATKDITCAKRGNFLPEHKGIAFGFRCAKDAR